MLYWSIPPATITRNSSIKLAPITPRKVFSVLRRKGGQCRPSSPLVVMRSSIVSMVVVLVEVSNTVALLAIRRVVEFEMTCVGLKWVFIAVMLFYRWYDRMLCTITARSESHCPHCIHLMDSCVEFKSNAGSNRGLLVLFSVQDYLLFLLRFLACSWSRLERRCLHYYLKCASTSAARFEAVPVRFYDPPTNSVVQ